jgi:hypothetical protein
VATALRREHANVDSVAIDDVLIADRRLRRDFLRRHFPPQFPLKYLHGLKRMIHRLLADH